MKVFPVNGYYCEFLRYLNVQSHHLAVAVGEPAGDLVVNSLIRRSALLIKYCRHHPQTQLLKNQLRSIESFVFEKVMHLILVLMSMRCVFRGCPYI